MGSPVIPTYALAAAVLTGTAVTIAASLVPIRAATRIKPLAALHPLDSAEAARMSPGRRRLLGVLSLLSLAGLFAAATADRLPVALLAGAVNFCALVLLVRAHASRLIALAGRTLRGPGGIPARLAAENIRRHPRRTGAAVIALLIGVTLTSSVLVGVSAARATANRGLDDTYPFDVTVTAGSAAFPEDIGARLHRVHGVTAATALASGRLRADGHVIDAVGIDLSTVARVSRTSQAADLPSPGHVTMSYRLADRLGLTEGTALRLSGDRSGLRLTVSIAQVPGLAADTVALARTDLDALSARTSVRQLWVRLSDGSTGHERQTDLANLAKAATAASPGAELRANVSTRESLDTVLNFLLAVVLGLLAVTVVIATLGLGNTLALSAVERSRESAMLRAVGGTRRQLAATVVWEAVQISAVSTAVGCGLGIVYGLVGVRAVLYDVQIVVPWSQLGVLGCAAILAGVIASLVPAWRTTGGAIVDRLAVTH